MKAKLNRLKKKEFRDAYVASHLSHGLAHQIRALRTQRGWTQAELAENLGLKGQSAVARMEDPSYGKLSQGTLLKLAQVFDVALSSRFVSFSQFILEREDVSVLNLCVSAFTDEVQSLAQDIDRASKIGSYGKYVEAPPLSFDSLSHYVEMPNDGSSSSYMLKCQMMGVAQPTQSIKNLMTLGA